MAAVLSWSDYVVIGIMLLVCLAIGIYYRFTGGRQKTIEVNRFTRRVRICEFNLNVSHRNISMRINL